LTVYLIKRIAMAVLVIVLVMVLLALLVHLVPGDPAKIILRQRATPQLIAQVRAEMGLNKSILAQVWDFVIGALQGNLGTDFVSQAPVSSLIAQALPDTFILAFTSMILSVLVGVPLGVFVASRPNGLLDRTIGAISMVLISALPYVFSLGLLLIFAVHWHLLPALGTGSPSSPGDYLRHLILPAIALAIPWWGYIPRLVRASMLEVLGSNYIRTARSLGFRERTIFYKYAFKNALVPVAALFGLMLGYSLAGTIYAETIFGRSGLGSLALGAIADRNWPVIRGTVLIYALFYIFGNLVSDLSYRFLDPRIRVEKGVEVPV